MSEEERQRLSLELQQDYAAYVRRSRTEALCKLTTAEDKARIFALAED